MKLHEDEFEISASLVRGFLLSQFPEWAGLPLQLHEGSGTVSVVFRLGDALAVRLPRSPSFATEADLLVSVGEILPDDLPLEVPRLRAVGSPAAGYPCQWLITDWLPGSTPQAEELAHSQPAARDLGEFVARLRAIEPGGFVVRHYRGEPLRRRDARTREAIVAVADEFDSDALIGVWSHALGIPDYTGPPHLFHGDLHTGNLLVQGGSLTAVIDFGGSAIGDPSVDALSAWWVFSESTRSEFRSAGGFTDEMWERARGWALSVALIALPYYRESNPVFADMARRAIRQVLADQ